MVGAQLTGAPRGNSRGSVLKAPAFAGFCARRLTIPLERGMLKSGERADRGSQRRTALRTRRSIAASRRTAWPRRRRCVQWADSSTLGASARFTWVSYTCGVGAPTVESFAVPTVPRFRSESNGVHSRRCSGSVSAFQAFAGGWGRSRTRTSVHFSPSFRTSAPEAAPRAYCSRLLMSFLCFHRRSLLHLFQVLLQGIDVL